MKVERGAQAGVSERVASVEIDNRTIEQRARIYHKFNNARGSDYVRAGSMELDAAETMEEELVNITGGVR